MEVLPVATLVLLLSPPSSGILRKQDLQQPKEQWSMEVKCDRPEEPAPGVFGAPGGLPTDEQGATVTM